MVTKNTRYFVTPVKDHAMGIDLDFGGSGKTPSDPQPSDDGKKGAQKPRAAEILTGDDILNRLTSLLNKNSGAKITAPKGEGSFDAINAEFIAAILANNLYRAVATHRRGADITRDNNFAVRKAAQLGFLPIVQWLAQNGADIRADDDYAFRQACANGHLETAQWLADSGANIRAASDFAIVQAAINNHLPVVTWLHDKGADILTVGDYVMRKCFESGHKDTCEWLRTKGVSIENFPDDTITRAVRAHGPELTVGWLWKATTASRVNKHITKTIVAAAVEANDPEHLIALVEGGVPYKTIQPLVSAALQDQKKSKIRDFLENGTDLERKSLVTSAISDALKNHASGGNTPKPPKPW